MSSLCELKDQVGIYNKYMDQTMRVGEIDPDYYVLIINGNEITKGDAYDLLTRVKGINRENGLNHLGG